jgi:hypothetical protein
MDSINKHKQTLGIGGIKWILEKLKICLKIIPFAFCNGVIAGGDGLPVDFLVKAVQLRVSVPLRLGDVKVAGGSAVLLGSIS